MPKTILLIQIFSIAAAGGLVAQDIDRKPWDLTLHIYPSLSSPASDWSMTHPIYGGSGGVSYETITGTFEQSLSVTAGGEMRRGHYGIQGNVSFMPQTLTKSQPIHEIELTLVMGEVGLLYFPPRFSGKVFKPYVSLGSGLLKTAGDIDNTGLILSYAVGARIPLSPRLGCLLGLKGRYLKYTQLQLADAIAKDISIDVFQLSGGVFYRL